MFDNTLTHFSFDADEQKINKKLRWTKVNYKDFNQNPSAYLYEINDDGSKHAPNDSEWNSLTGRRQGSSAKKWNIDIIIFGIYDAGLDNSSLNADLSWSGYTQVRRFMVDGGGMFAGHDSIFYCSGSATSTGVANDSAMWFTHRQQCVGYLYNTWKNINPTSEYGKCILEMMNSAPDVRSVITSMYGVSAMSGVGAFQSGRNGRPICNQFTCRHSADDVWVYQGKPYMEMLTLEFCEGYLSSAESYGVRSAPAYPSNSQIGLNSAYNASAMAICTVALTQTSQFNETPFKLGSRGDVIYALDCHTISQYIMPQYHDNLLGEFYNAASYVGDTTYAGTELGYTRMNRHNTFCYASGQMSQLQTGHSAMSGKNPEYGYTKQEYEFMVNLMFHLNKRLLRVKDYTTKGFKDNANPDAPVIKVSDDKSSISWTKPQDRGTTYTYKVEKQSSTGAITILGLNKTFTNTKGIDHYRYCVDTNPNTQIDYQTSNVTRVDDTSGASLEVVDLRGSNYTGILYFHVTAVDGAGNMSVTSHYTLPPIADYSVAHMYEKSGYTSLNQELDGKFDDISNYDNLENTNGTLIVGTVFDFVERQIEKTGFVPALYRRGTEAVNITPAREILINTNNPFTVFYRRWRYAIQYLSTGHTWQADNRQAKTLKWGSPYTLEGYENYYTRKILVHFDTQGGEDIPDILQEDEFVKWNYNNGSIGDKGVVDGTEFADMKDSAVIDLTAEWKVKPIPEMPLPKRANSVFFGWYTKPQGELDAKFVCDGLQKDVDMSQALTDAGFTTIPAEVTLYAWYNTKPRFADIEDGYFFEGQKVSYEDLLHLVTVDDYEDDMLLLYNQAIDEWAFDMSEKLDEKINRYSDMDAVDDAEQQRIDAHLDKLRQEQDNIEAIASAARTKAEEFSGIHPVIKSVQYYSGVDESDSKVYTSGVHPHMVYSSTGEIVRDIEAPDGEPIPLAQSYNKAFYKSNYLETGSNHVGYLDIVYQVRDTGIPIRGLMRELDISQSDLEDIPTVGVIPNTDVVVEYKREHCHIQFNYNPTIIPQSMQSVTSENYGGDLVSWILQFQYVKDPEDSQSNEPWWSKKSASEAHGDNMVENTVSMLQSTKHITGIPKIILDGGFRYKYPKTAEKFLAEFAGLEEDMNRSDRSADVERLFSFYGSKETYNIENGYRIYKADVWDNIATVAFIIDAEDQWGKTASNKSFNATVDVFRMPKGYGKGEVITDYASLSGDEKLALLRETHRNPYGDKSYAELTPEEQASVDSAEFYLFNSFVVGDNWNYVDSYDDIVFQSPEQRTVWLTLFFDKSSRDDKYPYDPDPDPDDPDPDWPHGGDPDDPPGDNPGLIQGIPDRIEIDTASTQVQDKVRYVADSDTEFLTDKEYGFVRSFWDSVAGQNILEQVHENFDEVETEWDHTGRDEGKTIRIKDHTK